MLMADDIVATAQELIDALKNLDSSCDVASWPGGIERVDRPGLYAWWVDNEAAATISSRLGEPVSAGIVYVGQAGAFKGGAGTEATLLSRVFGNHIGGKIRNSTLRLSAAAILLEDLSDCIEGDRIIGTEGEKLVSDWLKAHFRITLASVDDRAQLAQLENVVLASLDPPINLLGMPTTRLRANLRARRSKLRTRIIRTASSRTTEVASALRKSGVRVTLHDEISRILESYDNRWLDNSQIALLINQRGRYTKRDGSPVSDFQVHGRTRNYPKIFERRGAKVRLLVGQASS